MVTVALLPNPGAGAPATPSATASSSAPVSTLSGTLQIGPLVAHPYDGFWSVVLTGTRLANSTLAAELNQTPFVLLRYGGEIDATNASNGCTYSDSGVCGREDVNYTEFKILCGWIHCLSVLGVPGEPDNPGLAADTVRYVEQTVGYTPTFWSIGNEPESWTHWGIPFTSWRPTDHSTPDAAEYGLEVERLSKAMLSVDPHARIIGDQDAQEAPTLGFLKDIALDANDEVGAVAFHSYPGRYGSAHPTVAQFLSKFNVTRTNYYLSIDRAAYDLACTCAKPVMVGEFSGGFGQTGDRLAPFVSGYPEVPMTAAVAAQLLTANASVFTYFAFWGGQPYDLVDQYTGATDPTYALYARILHYLPMGGTHVATVVTSLPGVYAVQENDNASGAGLLLVNTNTTTALNLSLSGWFGGGAGAVLSDSPVRGVHSHYFVSGTAPATIRLPPEGVKLLLRGAATDGVPGSGTSHSPRSVRPGGSILEPNSTNGRESPRDGGAGAAPPTTLAAPALGLRPSRPRVR